MRRLTSELIVMFIFIPVRVVFSGCSRYLCLYVLKRNLYDTKNIGMHKRMFCCDATFSSIGVDAIFQFNVTCV
jgi:hypothetical protein